MLEDLIDVMGYLAEDSGLDRYLYSKGKYLFCKIHDVDNQEQIKAVLPAIDDYARDLWEAGERDYADQVWDALENLREDLD